MSMINTVRLALPSEAVDIARIQRRSWALNPALASANDLISAAEAARTWHEAIVRPPLAHLRVLVAIGTAGVAGFAVTGPLADPDAAPTDGLIGEFVVDPAQLGAGHGSRLISAAVDTLRADGYETAQLWVPSTHDALRTFLASCGFAPDGAHKELHSDDGSVLKLVRVHCAIL